MTICDLDEGQQRWMCFEGLMSLYQILSLGASGALISPLPSRKSGARKAEQCLSLDWELSVGANAVQESE